MGATTVTIEGTYGWQQPPAPGSEPADPILVLAPGESGLIPAFANPALLPDMTLTLRNTTGQPIAGLPAHVTMEEAYSFDLDAIGNPGGPVFTADVRRAGPLVGDSFEFLFTGQDASNGSAFHMIVQDPGALTAGIDPGDLAPGDAAAAPLRNLAALPNPFRFETQIEFALSRAGQVGVKIYDTQGRLVRALDPARFAAGKAAISWDGREADGGRVGPGVFFYRVNLDGREAGHGKLVLLSR